jgi:hypothetical protein
MTKIVAPTVKFIRDHKVAVAVTLTTAVCVMLARKAANERDDFLKEHGLFDEYHAIED